ncbi:D-Ala-D-Ala carboxypeptidase family metallohydrolase [Amycolatopsis sp. NBC_00355]|uniref:D-Ala-D-Ala carboxypeptidase family metallohydrolase n=1 Tax=Amycolatopsis sp. NBC_00355 TaxID=2975957 RepID=UPI002E270EDF
MSLFRPSAGIGRRTLLKAAAGTGVALAGSLAAMAAFPGIAAAYSWPSSLRSGSTGAAVKELQIRVAGWAADGPQQTYVAVDGEFGPGTEAALKRFQAANHLTADGVADADDFATLNALESADGSTSHFEFSEFTSNDGTGFGGGKVGSATVKENVRRLMYKLEALRAKGGNRAITISSGFRSVAHNQAIGGASNSMHVYGTAADIYVSGLSTRQVYVLAEACGFSGLERYTLSDAHQHVDSRIEYAYGSQSWWWESGTVS